MVKAGREKGKRMSVRSSGRAPVAITIVLLLALPILTPFPQARGAGGDPESVEVLFYFREEYYVWGKVRISGAADAVSVSYSAASDLDKVFQYDESGGQIFIEIGGLSPPPDSWVWCLLLWNISNSRWEPWERGARELLLRPGDAIAWCPSDLSPPVPDPLSKYPWPMFRSTSGRTGESLSPAPLSNLTQWTTDLSSPVDSTPCVADGKVFVLAGGRGRGPARLLCLDEYSGRLLWQKNLSASDRQYSSPAFHSGMVFFGLSDGRFLAVDALTGETAWEFRARSSEIGISSSPVVHKGHILIAAGDGYVYCLNATGTKRWERDTGAPVHLCSPAVRGGKVLIGNEAGRFLCLNLTDGDILWSAELGGRIRATPAISYEKSENYVFVSVLREELSIFSLYQFYIPDGTYQFNTSYPASISSPALLGGGLYIGTSAEFVGHHPDRNQRFWGLPFAPVDTSAAAARGYVYFGTSGGRGTMVCARTSGFLEWTFHSESPFFSSPVLADGRVFACTKDGQLYCLGRSPATRIEGFLQGPSRATEGSEVKLRLTLNNTGDLGTTISLWLTVDGARSSPREGPLELLPGDIKEVSLVWRAREGRHVLGVELNGTDAEVNTVTVEVTKAPRTCAIAAALAILLAFSAPLLLVRGGRGGIWKGKTLYCASRELFRNRGVVEE
ncbi:MAG: PQQ-binding-like beta-propeller repeat protein [Thermoplasmata archaeon]